MGVQGCVLAPTVATGRILCPLRGSPAALPERLPLGTEDGQSSWSDRAVWLISGWRWCGCLSSAACFPLVLAALTATFLPLYSLEQAVYVAGGQSELSSKFSYANISCFKALKIPIIVRLKVLLLECFIFLISTDAVEIMESQDALGWKGPSRGNPPAVSRNIFNQTRLLRAPSNLALNASRDGASPTSLGSPSQCLTTLVVNNSFLTSSVNLPFFSLDPSPLLLSQQALLKSLSPAFL